MTRTIAALLLASCVVGVFAAPAANADRSQETIFDASNNRGGLVDSLLDGADEEGLRAVTEVVSSARTGTPLKSRRMSSVHGPDVHGVPASASSASVRKCSRTGVTRSSRVAWKS